MQHSELLLRYVYQSDYKHLYVRTPTIVITLCYTKKVQAYTVELASQVVYVQCFSVL